MKKTIPFNPTFAILAVLSLTALSFSVTLSACGTLNSAGATYVLDRNLAATAGSTCLTVRAGNIVIDCAGHSITGSSPAWGQAGIYPFGNTPNTQIKNCIIDGFYWGVSVSPEYANQYPSVKIINSTISASSIGVIAAAGSPGGDLIINSSITGSSGSATYLGSGVSYNNSYFYGNDGIQTSSGDKISNCTISASRYGIIGYSNGVVVKNSSVYGGSGGILFMMGSGGAVVANSSVSGVFLAGDSGSNTFYNNTLYSPSASIPTVRIAFGTGNTFYWNNFTSTSGLYINDTKTGNKYNTTINSKPEGNIYPNVIDGTIKIYGVNSSTRFPSLYAGSSGSGYPYSSSTSGGKISGNAVDYAPLTPFNITASYGNLTVNYTSGGTAAGSNSTFTPSANLSISAAPSEGYSFQNWTVTTGNCSVLNVTNTSTTILVNDVARCNVQANFAQSCLSTCQNLGTANKVYTLCNNVNINGATCFNVQARNVSLDCAGYSMTGNNSSDTYGVYSNQDNTTIKNCNIMNFSTGIYLTGSNRYAQINNVNISTTKKYVYSQSNGMGIYSDSTSYGLINNTNISVLTNCSESLGYAIFLRSSSYNNITYASYVGCYGLRLESSNSNIISNINGTASFSTIGLSQSNQNRIENSTVIALETGGTILSASNYNVIKNITTGARDSGLRLAQKSEGNIINGTYIYATNAYSPHAEYSAVYIDNALNNNNTFINNTFVSTNKSLTLLHIYIIASNNTFYWNNFTETSSFYIKSLNASNNYNATTPSGTNEGNIYPNVINGSVSIAGRVNSSGFPALYIGASGAGYPFSSSTSQGKMVGASDYAPLTPSLWECLSTCQNLGTANKVYTLCNNVNISGSNCFNITAQNVSLECNGYSISGNNSADTYGVYAISANYANISNCIIYGFGEGIYFNGAAYGGVYNTQANGSSKGIHLAQSSRIVNSTGFSDSGTGIELNNGGSTNNSVINSTGISNSGYGISISGNNAYNHQIINSLGISNTGAGMHLYFAENDLINNSTGRSNTGAGIELISSNSITITRSTGNSTSGAGILAVTSNSNTIANSTGISGSSDGIILMNSCSNNRIVDSTFNAGLYGVYIQAASSNTISNSMIRSTDKPVYLYLGTNNQIYNNTLISNATLLLLDESSTGNKVYWNNFTETNSLYIQDNSGGNSFNATTPFGTNEGNIYANVISREVEINGSTSSSGFPALYMGTTGAYPYDSGNSQGKVSSNVIDYSPLTPFISLVQRLSYGVRVPGHGIYIQDSNGVSVARSTGDSKRGAGIYLDSDTEVVANNIEGYSYGFPSVLNPDGLGSGAPLPGSGIVLYGISNAVINTCIGQFTYPDNYAEYLTSDSGPAALGVSPYAASIVINGDSNSLKNCQALSNGIYNGGTNTYFENVRNCIDCGDAVSRYYGGSENPASKGNLGWWAGTRYGGTEFAVGTRYWPNDRQIDQP